MFWRLIGLGAALCLVLMPATGVAGEPDKPADEAAEADQLMGDDEHAPLLLPLDDDGSNVVLPLPF